MIINIFRVQRFATIASERKGFKGEAKEVKGDIRPSHEIAFGREYRAVVGVQKKRS